MSDGLTKLQHERTRLQHAVQSDAASLESLRNAAKRAGALIDHLQKHGVSESEAKLLPLLRGDRENLHKRAQDALKRRHADKKHLRNVRHRIHQWRQRHHDTHGSGGAMFDSIDLSQFPSDPRAVAGYTSGYWPTYNSLVAKYPGALKLSIAIAADHDADCLDVEPGDATPEQAAGWVKRQHGRGVHRPCVYCSVSQAAGVIHLLGAAGIGRHEFTLWTAHYTFTAHRCDPSCGYGLTTTADATQWTDRSGGRNLDESLCNATIPWHR